MCVPRFLFPSTALPSRRFSFHFLILTLEKVWIEIQVMTLLYSKRMHFNPTWKLIKANFVLNKQKSWRLWNIWKEWNEGFLDWWCGNLYPRNCWLFADSLYDLSSLSIYKCYKFSIWILFSLLCCLGMKFINFHIERRASSDSESKANIKSPAKLFSFAIKCRVETINKCSFKTTMNRFLKLWK